MGSAARSINEYAGYIPRPTDRIARESASITPDTLWDRYISKRRPVVIEGLLQDEEWKGDRWTLEHLRQVAGESMVKVEPKGRAGHFGTAAPRQTMKFSKFLDLMQDPKEAPLWYLTTQYEAEEEDKEEEEDEDDSSHSNGHSGEASAVSNGNVSEHLSVTDEDVQVLEEPELDPVFPNPTAALAEEFPHRPSLLSGLVLQQANLWLGSSGPPGSSSSSGLHHDHHDNLYMLLSGHKRFLLFPPPAYRYLWPSGSVDKVHRNGFIVYTPPDELPSTHRLSRFKGLRPDGLSPLETAQWRLKACARALQEADDRAAAASGEGAVAAQNRKGKAKQTAEQADAVERYIEAESLLLLTRLEEQESADSDALDSDDESDDLDNLIAFNDLSKRRIAQLHADADDDDDMDDDTFPDVLHQLLDRAANGDEEAALTLRPYLKQLEQNDSRGEYLDDDDDGDSDTSGDSADLYEKGSFAHTCRSLFVAAEEGDEASMDYFFKGLAILREEGGITEFNPQDTSMITTFRSYLRQGRKGDNDARHVLTAAFGNLLGFANTSDTEESDSHTKKPNGPGSGSLAEDFEDERTFLSKVANESEEGSSVDETDSDESETDLELEEEEEALIIAEMERKGRKGAPRPPQDPIAPALSDESESEESDEEEAGAFFPQAEDQDESDWEGLDGMDGEEVLARLGDAQDDDEDDDHDDDSLGAEGKLAHPRAHINGDTAGPQLSASYDDVGGVGDDEEMPQSFSLIKPSVLHAYFDVSDDISDATKRSGNGSGTRLERKALKRAAAKKRKRDANRLANGRELTPLRGCPRPLVADLKPGEMLYLPASWWHEVTSSTSADGAPHMAFNYWMYPPTALDRVAEPTAGGTTKANEALLGSRHSPYYAPVIWGEIARSVEEQVVRHQAAAREARLKREETSMTKISKPKTKRGREESFDGDAAADLAHPATNGGTNGSHKSSKKKARGQ